MIENEIDSQFADYRDIDEDGKEQNVNYELSKLTIHLFLQKLEIDNVITDFDATGLYPSAMWDEKTVYPKIENGFAFKLYMNDVFVGVFIIQSFHQDGNQSAIVKLNFYEKPDLVFQLLPIRERVENIEINRMKKG